MRTDLCPRATDGVEGGPIEPGEGGSHFLWRTDMDRRSRRSVLCEAEGVRQAMLGCGPPAVCWRRGLESQ